MPLTPGTRLGPYEVTGSLGAGGMGEVYRARDTRLEREARTISTLTHPHICALYDVGDHEGVPYLVMEHLAGETLATRLAKGPLPLEQALDLGAQIAEALDTLDMVVHDVGADGAIAPSGRPLFRLGPIRAETYYPVPGFDVTPDGKRFLFAQYSDTPPGPPPKEIHVVFNWFEELKAKVPAGK